MKIYRITIDRKRRFLWGSYAWMSRERCPICRRGQAIPESQRKYVELTQGSFVSNILWLIWDMYATQELKETLMQEGFTGIDFEETEVVKDRRPSQDKQKLPFEEIPPFYRVKFIASAHLHSDFLKLYNAERCSGCGRLIDTHKIEPYILDASRLPETDFLRLEEYRFPKLCTERGKQFLEAYPKTYCRFTLCELRD